MCMLIGRSRGGTRVISLPRPLWAKIIRPMRAEIFLGPHLHFKDQRTRNLFGVPTLERSLDPSLIYIEDITRWREDMNFMFEWQQQYLTSERSERVRYCSCHENIKFISSSHRVMFFLLYGD